MPAPAIQLQQLTKHRRGRAVLSALDLEVPAGEFLGLIGVNGAGKTTLIKCLLDLDSVTSGKALIFGLRHSVVEARKELAYLPEKFLPPCYLTGREFLRYLSELHGNEFDADEAESVLRLLDFETAAMDRPVSRLSGGMTQKLGVAACLLSGKRLLILDEPMSGLDLRARICLRRRLLELKKQGHTCFFSTHLLADAEKLCDRIAILHQGGIRYVGSPADCRRHFNAPDLEQAYLCCVGPAPVPECGDTTAAQPAGETSRERRKPPAC